MRLVLLLHRACCYNCSKFQLMHLYTLKHQLTLTFKTLKNRLKKPFSDVTPTCFGPLIRPSSGGSYAVLCAVTGLGSADLRSLIVCAVCGCMCLSSVLCVCVCVTGALVGVRSGYGNT
jgi:hypothetical protein